MIESVARLRRPNTGEREIAAIYALLELMHAEVGMAALAPKKVRAAIDTCLDLGVICVALEEEKIVGTMGLVLSEWWYSDDPFIQEMWTFVHPDHRRSRHARNLLTDAIAAAAQLKVPLLAGVTSTHRTEGKCRLYRRLMTTTGEFFMTKAA